MFLSQQMKPIAIITNKNGKYELTNELPNDVKHKKISKFYGIKVFKLLSIKLLPSLFPQMKILSILAKN